MAASTSDIVILSNRLPVNRVQRGNRKVWETSPGGLVSALTPILREKPSTWIGWSGIHGKAPKPFEHDGILNHPVALSPDEIENFYEGFSNSTLWPLYHDAIRTPIYHRHWWRPYKAVNQRFAKIAAQVTAKNGLLWIHDYHFQLVPAMVRELRPDIRIGFFLHIPFPPQELFAQLPWRRQILEGLLGADVVGFQTVFGAQNFTQLCRRFTNVSSGSRLMFNNRRVIAKAFPISIDADKFESLAMSEEIQTRAANFKAKLGLGRRILLGVDRLDYTKGIEIRFKAFHELLKSKQVSIDDTVFVQVAVPSRERVDDYRRLKDDVERTVGMINGEYGELGTSPIHYLHRGLPVEELVALYLAADAMIVTPFRDGMNLVAKEYVACRHRNDGALVLSEFTGSAIELKHALLVNPHDVDDLAKTIHDSVNLPRDEQSTRMKKLRKIVMNNTVYDWANSFFEALSK